MATVVRGDRAVMTDSPVPVIGQVMRLRANLFASCSGCPSKLTRATKFYSLGFRTTDSE